MIFHLVSKNGCKIVSKSCKIVYFVFDLWFFDKLYGDVMLSFTGILGDVKYYGRGFTRLGYFV
jgi:hypothetical protein